MLEHFDLWQVNYSTFKKRDGRTREENEFIKSSRGSKLQHEKNRKLRKKQDFKSNLRYTYKNIKALARMRKENVQVD